MNGKAKITGTGHYVPPKVVTNFDLEKKMNTSDEWIRTRSGIKERHYTEVGVGSSELGSKAALQAIEESGIDKSEIDLIIAATLSPDFYFPGIGVLIQAQLELENVGAIDIRNQCSGFIYALSIADQYVSSGAYKKVLLVAAEVQSSNLDYSDKGRDLAVLFGDGAGAVIIEPNEDNNGSGILSTHLFSDGQFADKLCMEKPSPKDKPIISEALLASGGFSPKMHGRHVFKTASEKMPQAVRAALKHNNIHIDDLNWLIPHQANDRISQMVAKNLNLPTEKVISNIAKYGNTTAASIPIALDEAIKEGRIKRNDLIMLTAFGSGYTWASALIRY